jgi:archaellum component FlaC
MVEDRVEERMHTLENQLDRHEVQCEERWKTNFQRLGDIEKAVERMESRIITVGGAVIVFLAGLVVTVFSG